jgi:outer membrane protein assembly factor BamA
MKRRIAILICILLYNGNILSGQDKPKEEMKKGWSFGFFPAFGYDSNTGVKYGGILKLFNYGDGSSYPAYDQSLHFEWSRTTKGTGVNQLIYETRTLIPGIRILAEASYLTEKALNFYGFNGYNAYYNSHYSTSGDPLYRSSVFYSMDREMIKMKLEFIGKLKGDKLKWFGGFEYFNNKLDTVDINNLNKGKDQAHLLPSVGGGLYGNFVKWGLIPKDQVHGGQTSVFKLGVKYDTRDKESNPSTGLWTEMQLLLVPGFLSDGYGYTRFAFTHRQYFSFIQKRVTLAYRVSYQAKLSGDMPFYMLPLVFNSAPQITLSGLGGSTTIRGILRNRVVGEDFAYGNAELRWKVFRAIILNQNFYFVLAGFTDAGMITGKYKLPEITDPEGLAWLAKGEKEKPHVTYGGGAHVAINDNFVITMDYGWTTNPQDGTRGTYIGLNFLF